MLYELEMDANQSVYSAFLFTGSTKYEIFIKCKNKFNFFCKKEISINVIGKSNRLDKYEKMILNFNFSEIEDCMKSSNPPCCEVPRVIFTRLINGDIKVYCNYDMECR
jgi:hypothetical protein